MLSWSRPAKNCPSCRIAMDKGMNLGKVSFTDMLVAKNGIATEDFIHWSFHPGMLFQSDEKWWGDFGQRDFPHEGIDLCLYQTPGGGVRQLGAGTRIPVMHGGVVRALFKDYLGQAVILEHENVSGIDGKLLSVYAHTRPQAGIEPGVTVKAGDVIATIADTSRSKANILPHLHLSFGYPSAELVYEPFVWNSMRDPRQVALIDPLSFIDWPHQVLESNDQNFPRSVRPINGAVS